MNPLRIILIGAAAGAVVALATSKVGRDLISKVIAGYGDKVEGIAEGITNVVKNNANRFIKSSVNDAAEQLAVAKA